MAGLFTLRVFADNIASTKSIINSEFLFILVAIQPQMGFITEYDKSLLPAALEPIQ